MTPLIFGVMESAHAATWQLTPEMRMKYSKCVYTTVSDLIGTSDLVSLVPLDKINWSPDHHTPSCDCPRNSHSHQIHIRFYYTTKCRCMFPWQQDLQMSHNVVRKHHVPLHICTYTLQLPHQNQIYHGATVNAHTYVLYIHEKNPLWLGRWGHVECTSSANTWMMILPNVSTFTWLSLSVACTV